jgi:AcrR family transcriptional regulator
VPARRDAGRPRGAPIERALLHATLDELAEHGLEGLSMARIAAAAEVNKTTVYRRWPTREALVSAALEGALRESSETLADTGSLRGDLRAAVQAAAARMQSSTGRALARAAMSLPPGSRQDPSGPDRSAALGLVERAVARGEWDPARVPPDAVFSLLTGGVLHRVMLEGHPITEGWVDVVVDVIARGVAPR